MCPPHCTCLLCQGDIDEVLDRIRVGRRPRNPLRRDLPELDLNPTPRELERMLPR